MQTHRLEEIGEILIQGILRLRTRESLEPRNKRLDIRDVPRHVHDTAQLNQSNQNE